jgi:hypothetical protein
LFAVDYACHLGWAILSGEMLLLLLNAADAVANGLPMTSAVPANCCCCLLSSACCSKLPAALMLLPS